MRTATPTTPTVVTAPAPSSTTVLTVRGESTVSAPTQTVVLGDQGSSCADGAKVRDPVTLLKAFARARVDGRGAEACLSPSALAAYDDASVTDQDFLRSPGPKCLYRCGHYIIVEMVLDESQTSPNRDGSKTFAVTVTLKGTTQDTNPVLQRLYEYLTVSARNGRQVIVNVSNT